jgi:glycosyltransferase involved in cell wall biosynthesis
MSTPLISIIIPTLNQARFIEQTLASVSGQGWPRLEIIVVDGGSSDGTHAIIERYHHVVTHFISEPDTGQANAINKGMRLAKGDILAWLNSDDYYLPLTLARAAAGLENLTRPHLVYGGCLMLFERAQRALMAPAHAFDRVRLTYCDLIYQPSAFWTRPLWEKTGELTERYHFVLDWEWWLRAATHGEFVALDDCLSVYRFHDAHKTSARSPRRSTEIVELVTAYAPPEWVAAYHAVARRLDRLEKTWRYCANRRGLWTLHQLVHLDLYARHGAKVDQAFSQLHVG